MCIALPARVLAIEGADAVVDVEGRRRRASLVLGPEIAVGDWALVAAGSVLRRLDLDEAAELSELLRPVMRAPMKTFDQDVSPQGGRGR